MSQKILDYRSPSLPRGRARWPRVLVGLIASFSLLLGAAFILTPSRSANRSTADKVGYSMRVHSIGVVLQLYARSHDGWLPDSLTTLAESDPTFDRGWLACPATHAKTANSFAQMRAESAGDPAATVRTHCSYVYLGAGLRLQDLDEGVVLLYEPLENHDRDSASVIWGNFERDHLPYLKGRGVSAGAVNAIYASQKRGDHPVRLFLPQTSRPTTR